MQPVKWGIVSTAAIGMKKVIPAMLKAKGVEIVGIASRDAARAEAAAKSLGIPRFYGSYAALLADPEIEAVYNPLPNHLHVPVTLEAMKAGKHVLCEKPIALDAAEAKKLADAAEKSDLLVAEAFMVRCHPQWQRLREIVTNGQLGEVRLVQVAFSYFNDDPANVRNQADIGGGALFDIGCYAILAGRYLFGAEPARVASLVERDPRFGTDRLVSALLAFPGGRHLTFSVSTQLVPYQRVIAFGTKARAELEIPFNAIPDASMKLTIDDGGDLEGRSGRVERLPACDQYTLQAEDFSKALRAGKPRNGTWSGTFGAFGLHDSLSMMRVIDAVFLAAGQGRWVDI